MCACVTAGQPDLNRWTFLGQLSSPSFTHTRALTSQQSLLKREPRGPSGPGPQAITDFCKISGPCLHPHPEAASLSGFKSVEWTEVTTHGLPHPLVSSCGSVVEDEDVPARIHSKSASFFSCLWLCGRVPVARFKCGRRSPSSSSVCVFSLVV